jgi:dTDP-4-dehydrorhamnose 3,5-epimerase
MNVVPTSIDGLLILEPRVFEDARGYFFESYNARALASHGVHTVFVQDNQSRSGYGVIRGLHYQLPPYAQTKLVRAVEGCIYDVAVDLREGSPTFGRWEGVELSAENRRQLYVPQGFAHGFAVLSPTAVVQYKCDNYYSPGGEGGIIWNDAILNIDWKIPADQALISDKDQRLPTLAEGNYRGHF